MGKPGEGRGGVGRMRIVWFCLTAMLLFSVSVQAMGLEGDSVLGEPGERLEGGIHVSVRDEVTGRSDAFDSVPAGEGWKEHPLGRISPAATERWRCDGHGLKWELRFDGAVLGQEFYVEAKPIISCR